jgi:hypothetical protein
MLLGFFSVVIMLALGYAFLREGLFTAFCMCFNVFFAGLIAFNFFEPIADLLEPAFPVYKGADKPPYFWGYEDVIALMLLFSISLGLLRLLTNSLAPNEVKFQGPVRTGGAAVMGMATGYLLSGFLICMLQTLPWHQEFMFFSAKYEPNFLRSVLPPDRAWLALMHRAGAYAFSDSEDESVPEDAPLDERYQTFDRNGSFEQRYARYRRYGSNGAPQPYHGEAEADRKGKLYKSE